MPFTQLFLIFSFIMLSSIFLTYYVFKNKISASLTFVWFMICLVLAFMSLNYRFIQGLGKFFNATPSILLLTIIIFGLIIFVFYLLVKINTLFQWNKNIIQEIAILKQEKGLSEY